MDTPRQNIPSCSYLKVAFFGWLFVSYLPHLTSIFPSSYSGKRIFFHEIYFCRSSTDLLDVELIKENELGRCQRRKIFFVVLVWDVPHFHLLWFLINQQYEEGEMSQYIVFVYVFAFNFALNIPPLEICWAWSTIVSLVDTSTLFNYPHSSFLVVSSRFYFILVGVS